MASVNEPNTGGVLAVMQPSFLPWAGYFNLIAQADNFVFLDDVQLAKQSWQTRNRILVSGQVHWVSLPIRNVGLSQSLAKTEVIADARWLAKMESSFQQNYGRHPYFEDAREVLSRLRNDGRRQLAELNEDIIRFVADRLDLSPNFSRASALHVDGARTNRLVALCEYFEATEYLSPFGASDYLAEDGFEAQAKAALRLQQYAPANYRQAGREDFVPYLSIVDVLANLGWAGTRKYVCQEN